MEWNMAGARLPFGFDKAQSTRPKGHCVAVCLTSENPDDGFKHSSGKVQVSYEYSPAVSL